MLFTETPLAGAFIVDIEPREDERGFFARTWCAREFEEKGLDSRLVQCNISFNSRRGTLRGMHFQAAPFEEPKLVSVTQGAIFDVILDLRPDSPMYCRWHGVELTAENRRMLYVPKGFAHGFQTLCDDTQVSYQMGEFYQPEAARGVLWDDPAFAIRWPLPDPIISARDRSYDPFIPSSR